MRALFAEFGTILSDELRRQHDKPDTTLEVATGALAGAATGAAIQAGANAVADTVGHGAAQALNTTANTLADAGAGGLVLGVGTASVRLLMRKMRSQKQKDTDTKREIAQDIRYQSTMMRIVMAKNRRQAIDDEFKKRKAALEQESRDQRTARKVEGTAPTDKKAMEAKRRALFKARMASIFMNTRIAAAGALHMTGNLVKSKGYMVTGAVAGKAAAAAAPGLVAAAGGGGWLTASVLGVTGAAAVGALAGFAGIVGAAVVVDKTVRAVTGGDGFISPLFDYAVTALLSKDKAEHHKAINKMQRRYGVIGRRIERMMRPIIGPSLKEQRHDMSPYRVELEGIGEFGADATAATLPPQSSRRQIGARFIDLPKAAPAGKRVQKRRIFDVTAPA